MEEKNVVLGRNPVLEYLKSPKQNVKQLIVAESAHGKIIEDILRAASGKKVPLRHVQRDFFKQYGSSSTHQGVVLLLSDSTATPQTNEEALLKKVVELKNVLVLLDNISDPHNAGAIIRTAEALGAAGIVIPESNAVGITSTVIKTSAGATAHIPILNITNVAAFIDRAKNAGLWVIGTSDKSTVPILDIAKYRPALVIIGSEGSGMRRLTEEKCDSVVAIPLRGEISSLNASVAAGIILYEIMKDQ